MDTKKFLALLAVIISLAVFISLLFVFSKLSSPDLNQRSPLEECNVLSRSESGGAINLLFFSSKKNAEEYSEVLLSNEAFTGNEESFNVYYIDQYAPKCELYKNTALFCSSKELITKAASCPNDYIFVIQEKDREIRSSAFANVASINENNPLSVILHEFGHTFGNLAEEYVPAAIPRNAKNCARACEEFAGSNKGCYEGCSKETYFRSIESGVMRTLKSYDYGAFNEQILKGRIPEHNALETHGTGLAIDNSDCLLNTYYLLEGQYSEGKISITEKSFLQGCAPAHSTGDFSYKIISFSGEEILAGEFNPSLIFTDNQFENEGTISGETFSNTGGVFFLAVPFPLSRPESIEFYEGSNLLGKSALSDIGARPCKL